MGCQSKSPSPTVSRSHRKLSVPSSPTINPSRLARWSPLKSRSEHGKSPRAWQQQQQQQARVKLLYRHACARLGSPPQACKTDHCPLPMSPYSALENSVPLLSVLSPPSPLVSASACTTAGPLMCASYHHQPRRVARRVAMEQNRFSAGSEA
jgi:hypothetical protein